MLLRIDRSDATVLNCFSYGFGCVEKSVIAYDSEYLICAGLFYGMLPYQVMVAWLSGSVLDSINGGGGYRGSSPTTVQAWQPALCGSCPLVTPYYCRLGDLLCYNCMLSYHFVCMHVYFVFSLFSGLFSFVDFPSVLWYCWLALLTCKNRLPYNLYCVGGDVKHCTIQSNPSLDQRSYSTSGPVNTWMGDGLRVNHLGITSHLG